MQTVGPYELLELAGRGAAGEVYRARDSRDGRQVALKLLAKRDAAVPGATLRLRREFRAIQRLEHPHIVRVFESGENGRAWIAMEFVEGCNLLQAVGAAPGSPLKQDGYQALALLLAQVLEALAYVHSRQVLHRDLKPENILVDGEGRAKLVDFGLARLQDVTSDRLTHSGTLLGTPRYVAPEQALGAALDGRTDLYSVGVIAYEAVAGRPPCEGRTLTDLLTKRLSEAPTALSSWAPSVPRTLEQFVHKLLEIDPEERFASAAEALEALRSAETAPAAEGVSVTAERPLIRPRLVGRAEELAAVRRAFGLAAEGRPRLLLVEGEAGLGKSRLLQELRRQARRDRALLLESSSFEGASLPYAAFDGIFARLAAALGDDRTRHAREAARPVASDLKRVYSGFDAVRGWEAAEEPPEPEPGEAKRRVFEAVSRLLEQLAVEVPVVLICDDLHHFDGLSLELLKHLHARLVTGSAEKGLGLLMAIGLRPEECRTQEAAGDWLEARRQEPTSARVVLSPLNERHVAAMLASMLGESRERLEEAVVLRQITDGNPFFVEETVRSLHGEGQIRYMGEGWSVRLGASGLRRPSGELALEELAVPEKVRTTVRRRLRSLPEEVLRLLEKASVLGREFDVAVLATLAGDSEDVLLDGLDTLVRDGFLLESQAASDRLAFRHDLLRDVVHAGLGPLRRRRLHAQACQVYSRREGDDALVAVAHHAAAADDVATALTTLPRAAERLRRLHDPNGALRLLRRYLELDTSLDEEPRRERTGERHGVLAEVSRLELSIGNAAQAERDARMLVASALETGDVAAESEGRLCLGDALQRQTRFDLALEEGDRALEAALATGDREREVACRILRGFNLTRVARRKEGTAELRRAERLARRLGFDSGRLEALRLLASVNDDGSGLRRSLTRYQRCAELAEKLDRKEPQLEVLRSQAIQWARLGDLDAARDHFQRSRDLALQLGDRRWAAKVLHELGYCDHQTGRLAAAEAVYREVLAAMIEAGDFATVVFAMMSLGDLFFDAGRYDESRKVLEDLQADPRLSRLRREECYPIAYLAQIEIARGQYARAFEHLKAALEVTLELGRTDVLGLLHEMLARLFVAVADYKRASASIARASQLYRRSQLRGLAMTRVVRGLLLLEQGRVRMAEQVYEKLVALADEKRFVLEGLAARIGIARCLATRDPDAACEAALESYEETTRLGLVPLAAESAIVLIGTAPAAEAESSLAQALKLARGMSAPPLALRIHVAALVAGVGAREEHLREGRLALEAIEPHLGDFRASFMSRPELKLLGRR